MYQNLFIISLFFLAQYTIAQTKAILILNGTAHLGNGEVIQNSAIGFKDGKLILVADATTIRINLAEYDTVFDAYGKHVYPGIIASNTSLGLVEIGQLRASRDEAEVGEINPNVRTQIAYNTDSKLIPTIRTNGVLLAQCTPRSGLISGTSSIMMLNGWNWEDATYKADDGVHLNWPQTYTTSGWWAEHEEIKKNEQYEKQLQSLMEFFSSAQAYAKTDKPIKTDLKLDAMKNIYLGKANLYIHVNSSKTILETIAFAKRFSIFKMVIVGGDEAYTVTDVLKENKIPVILNRIHSLPASAEDDVDLPYKQPALLQKAGILFCLSYDGGMEEMGQRNLPFTAGTAAAYGLSKEEALMSITLNAAKILGIDKTTGSLEDGKDATLFISTGDALDMKTNNVELAFINGNMVDLNNSQKALYEKYKAKYQLK
jgi:imidazolonepropionase-like amidohydrolase